MKRKVMSAALFVVLLLTGVLTVVPFVWMVLSSFKTNAEISALEQTLLPRAFTLENYSSLQSNFNFLRYFGNSVFIAVIVTVLVIYISCICGFVLSKYQFRGKNLIFGFIMMTMMIPWSVTIISRYTMFVEAGLQDTYLSLILPAMVSGFGIFMMKQDIGALPDELLEAARIDGAGEWRILFTIVLPMSLPMIATMALLIGLGYWNDWKNGLYYLTDSRLYSIQNMLNQMLKDIQFLKSGADASAAADLAQDMPSVGIKMAIAVVGALPVMIVYPFFQKYFVKGITIGAVKG